MYKDVIFVKTWLEVNTLAEVLTKNGYEVLIHYDNVFEDESKNSYSIRFTHPRWDEDTFMTYNEYEEQKKVEKLIDEAEDDDLHEMTTFEELIQETPIKDINGRVLSMVKEHQKGKKKK